MKKLLQTRLHSDSERGNCFAAVIASIMDLDSAEDALQIQEHYDNEDWASVLLKWLNDRGYDWYSIDGHSKVKDEFYLVTGKSPRFSGEINHICIYQNGKLFHDPHPEQAGLSTESYFEVIEKMNQPNLYEAHHQKTHQLAEKPILQTQTGRQIRNH